MTTTPSPTPDAHDWLDEMLRADAREHAAGYVDDAGFTARVMATLPAPVQPLPSWRRPAVVAMWGAAAMGTLASFPDLAIDVGREAFRLLAAQPVSLPQIVVALAAAGFATWAAAAYALRSD